MNSYNSKYAIAEVLKHICNNDELRERWFGEILQCENITSDIKLVVNLCSQFQMNANDDLKYSTLFECFMKCLKKEDMPYYDNYENISRKIAIALRPILKDLDNLKNEFQALCNYLLGKSTRLFGRLLILLSKEEYSLSETEGFEIMLNHYFDSLGMKALDYDEMLNVAGIIVRANVYKERKENYYDICLQMDLIQLLDFVEKLYQHWKEQNDVDFSEIIGDSFRAFVNSLKKRKSHVDWFPFLKILFSDKDMFDNILDAIVNSYYDYTFKILETLLTVSPKI